MTDSHQNPPESGGSYFEDKARREQALHDQKLNGLYPLIITGLYLILGFVFHLWHPGWLIFFAIPLFYMRSEGKALPICNPVMITLIYLILGFFFHLWHPGWLIFLAIPASAVIQSAEKKHQ